MTGTRKLPKEFREYVDGVFDEQDVGLRYGTDWLGKVVVAMEEASAIDIAEQILKREGLHHTATTWKDFKEKRLAEALSSPKFGRAGILNMLGEMEENGRQHILFFRLKKEHQGRLSTLLRPKRVHDQLREKDLEKLLDSVPDPNTPAKPKLVHVRFEDEALIFKAIEAKLSVVAVETVPLADGRELRFNLRRARRRIKMARLHPDGLLEVRLGVVTDAGGDRLEGYRREAEEFLDAHRWLIERSMFVEVPLTDLKDALVEADDPLIAVPAQGIKTDKGGSVTVRASPGGGVAADHGCMASLRAGRDAPGSTYGRSVVEFFRKSEKQHEGGSTRVPAVVIVISGAPHELYTRRNATRADLNDVLRKIKRLGKL